jgi:NAD-dependent deacetylase
MRELVELIADSRYLVAFTGAGISAESGIPTYRDAGGLWQRYDPAKYADISYFHRDPSYYWRFFGDVRKPMLEQARPNAAHLALARLEVDGPLKAVITQNIDGLHQRAGSRQVVELHGNASRISCYSCGEPATLKRVYELLEQANPPTCDTCGGVLKPEIVFFGEVPPETAMADAESHSIDCDLFVVIGSSLVVYPAAQYPVVAKQNGARLVIINKEPTPLDGVADLVYHRSASEVLSAVAG